MASSNVPIRVLIADDHPVVRLGLTAMLDAHADVEVIGDVKDIAALLHCVSTARPDVVVLDLDLEPDGDDDMAALKSLRKHSQDTRIVVYTAHEEESRIVDALALGVEGYILKSADPNELLKAIHVVHRGGTLLHSNVASKLMKHMRSHPAGKQQAPFNMSRREMDVLRLMAEGKSNQKIADQLVISERTVKFHVSSILGKLEVENRTAAVLKATRNGILAQSNG